MIAAWRTRIANSGAANTLVAVTLFGATVLAADSVPLAGAALAAAEAEARSALAPLAEGAPTFDARQVFTVTEGGTRVHVLPARYRPRAPAPLANVDHCALALLQPGQTAEIVRTIGTGYTESLGCTGLDAIGFTDLVGDGGFEIALIYSTLAPPDRYRKTAVVVRRRGSAFEVDESLTAALDLQGGITTIGALRRAAAKLATKPSK